MARFVYELPMRWADMDALRHVNNVAYLRYIEQARIAMFYDGAQRTGRRSVAGSFVVARHEIDYLRPVVYHPEPLQLQSWVGRVRGASFVVHCEIFDGGQLAVRSTTTGVAVDPDAGRPRRLDDIEREGLALFADAAEPAAPASR